MTAHAACSPSSASMWLQCPASVTRTKDMTRPSSKYAREGTAAHMVAEMILKGDVFLPDKVKVEDQEFIVSRGMCQALNSYVSHVQSLMGPDVNLFFEQRVSVPWTDGMVWGTLDCGVFDARGNLHITDLKYGKGHLVAADTPQLKLYGLGLAEMLGLNLNSHSVSVTMTICQPRTGSVGVRSHTTQLWRLRDWAADHVVPAIQRIAAGDTTESAGSHCRWCVRQTECTAFAQLHQTRAADVFDDHEGAS